MKAVLDFWNRLLAAAPFGINREQARKQLTPVGA
jgi:hypothetical protein